MWDPPIDLHWAVQPVVHILVWGAWSAGVGLVGARRPAAAFARDRWWSRLRPFEAGGRWYERRLDIKAWKDRLPEAGAAFGGGISKRTLPAGADRRAGLQAYVEATRRAEWVHLVIPLAAPAFALWSWWWVNALLVAYALAANLPCLLVQRYNRARATSALARKAPPG